MTDLIASGYIENAARTVAEAKVALDNLRDVTAETGGKDSWTSSRELTISSGTITSACQLHSVDTEADAATDDLTNIAVTNAPEGRLLVICAENDARTVVCKHAFGGTGQLLLATNVDFTLDDIDKFLILEHISISWVEVCRCWGSDKTSAEFIAYQGHGTAAAKNFGTSDGNLIEVQPGSKLPALDGSDLTGILERGEYILIADIKSAGTNGGDFYSAVWRQRTLNTESIDEPSVATLASNRITLAAGTYYWHISAPAYACDGHIARLHETTDTITSGNMVSGVILGSSEYSTYGSFTTTRSIIRGKCTITAADVTAGRNIFEVQHRCTFTSLGLGFGRAVNIGVSETYTIVEIWKVA